MTCQLVPAPITVIAYRVFCTLRPAVPVSCWLTCATKVMLAEPKARIESTVVVPAATCFPPTLAAATPGAENASLICALSAAAVMACIGATYSAAVWV